MPPRSSTSFATMAAVILATGCSGAESFFAPTGGRPTGDLNKLDGRYAGVATYARGPDYCARRLDLALQVSNGRFEGELLDPRTPRATPARFDGPIDIDGSMAAIIRGGGDVLVLRGRLLETRFDGTMLPQASVDPSRENPRTNVFTNIRVNQAGSYCSWMVRLPRREG